MSAAVARTEKACTKCAQVKPLDRFHRHSRRKDGHFSTCADCCNQERKAKYEGSETQRNATARARAYYYANRQEILEKGRALCEQRREKRRAYTQSRREAHAKQVRARRDANPALRLHHRMSQGLRKQLRLGKAWQSTASLLGYTASELAAHLERQFTKGMSWENMGEWHIDHIVPLASFNVTSGDDPEFRRAWALTNLRPLWAAENLRKHARRETLL